MITDKDIKKLKDAFATKKDLEKLKRVFVTKIEFKESINILINEIKTVINMVGDVSQRLDSYHKDHEETFDNHERRLDRIEDKVFSTI